MNQSSGQELHRKDSSVPDEPLRLQEPVRVYSDLRIVVLRLAHEEQSQVPQRCEHNRRSRLRTPSRILE